MKITVCGDIFPTVHNVPLFEQGDTEHLFGDVLNVFENSDRVIANLECALTDGDYEPWRKIGPNLKAPEVCAKTLASAGITDCGLSNNHIFDYGIKGLQDTVRALEENKICYTGVGENEELSRKNHIIECEGKKITVIAVGEHEYSYALPNRMGARPYDPYDTMEDIRNAKKESDYVIVLYHGGKEHCEFPSPRLMKLCRAMSKNGADVVLCQHSHCIGCYEEYEGCHILYGQGNFHFVKRGHHSQHYLKYFKDNPRWDTGLIVQLDISEKTEISFLPTVECGCGITLAKGEEKETILNEFHKRNEMLKNGEWFEKWNEFCLKLKDDYIDAFSKAYLTTDDNFDNQLFLHFMDCEAQSDVWRELFKTWQTTNG